MDTVQGKHQLENNIYVFQLRMSAEYSRSVLRVAVAQICQTIGWHSINSTPLEFMVDLMQEYLMRIGKLTHQYGEVLGRTEANLNDVGLAFQHMNIDIQELAEYVRNVDSVPCAIDVPKFPVHRESHLNFLKPGSREVVTRLVHVHEHLPAMFPDTEEEYASDRGDSLNSCTPDLSLNGTPTAGSMNNSPQRISPQVVFKRPGDPVSFESPIAKRARVMEEGRPLREIRSVMMTTSGFLSPAREGKLPEARTPQQARSDSPPPSSYPMVPPELKTEKLKKIVKKGPEDRKLDKENKKKDRVKELFKPDKVEDSKDNKKLAGMKELAKLKPLKPGGGKRQAPASGPSSRPATPKLSPPKPVGSPKISKAAQSKAKQEKVIDLTSSLQPPQKKEENVDKLPSEPDKQKLNIFKKISKPRDDKEKEEKEHKHKDFDSRESSPGLIIDENIEKSASRIDAEGKREEKKTPHTPDVHFQSDLDLAGLQSPTSDGLIFDMSPPGTPSTPKTPDLNVPVQADQKKRRKEKGGRKKEPKIKNPKPCISPKKGKMSNDLIDMDTPDRPKTPQAFEPLPPRDPILQPPHPFFFPNFPPAPGLIPPTIGLPLFSRFPLSLGRGGPYPHPAMPNLPIPPRFSSPNPKPDNLLPTKVKQPERLKPLPIPLAAPLVPQQPVPETTMKTEKPEKLEKPDKEKVEKVSKLVKQQEKDTSSLVPVVVPTLASTPVPIPVPAIPVVVPVPAPAVQPLPMKNLKAEKSEKVDKKSKEHKKEKKEKLKKKKEKKEKHKEKGEKSKEKKEKTEKKEKAEKNKEKREKKEKRKEKEKEEKTIEAVPKITLKLGPASPRPPTPEATLMKKITIKPLVKKPEEELKREPSPELAKISALITRPPKQKSASKRIEEWALDASPTFPPDTSFSATVTSFTTPVPPLPRAKKQLFKALPEIEPEPQFTFPNPTSSPPPQQQAAFYFVLRDERDRDITKGFAGTEVKADAAAKKDDIREDKENGGNTMDSVPATTVDQEGRQVWICPACGTQDDGTPMIGCDDCDAWYHWVCVDMQIPPAKNEDWYCRLCIAKKQELHHDKKKKKRKKKVKVTA